MARQRFVLFVAVVILASNMQPAEARHVVTNGWVLSVGGADTERLQQEAPTNTAWRHLGIYGTVDIAYLWAISERFALLPAWGLAFAPDTNAWGCMFKLTAEFHLNDYVGLDLVAAVMHDQPGLQWSHAEMFAGVGPGVSVFLRGGRLILTAFVLFMHNVSHGHGGVIAPSFAVGWKI